MSRFISFTVFAFLLMNMFYFAPSGEMNMLMASEEVVGYAEPWQLDFQQPQSPVMEKIVSFHDALLVLITATSIFVLLLLIYVCIKFSKKNNPVPSKTSHHTLLEIIWTAIPVLILIVIAFPSFRLLYFMDRTTEADMTLKVIGYQWYWGYEYPDHDGLAFESRIIRDEDLGPNDVRLLSTDNKVVVPVGKNIKLLITAADVIHAWALPAAGVKMDAVPGRTNETWMRLDKPGIYYGQCSELCGRDHGFMPIEVHAVSEEEFKAWLEKAKQEFGNDNTAKYPKYALAE